MKIWLFGGSDIDSSWPCVFHHKTDAEAYLARYAKQELPEVARSHLEGALQEEENTARCPAHSKSCEHRPEWDYCVTVEEAERLSELVETAMEDDDVESWLLAYDYASKHDFEDLRAPSLGSLMEVPVVAIGGSNRLISDGARVGKIDEPRGFYVMGKTADGHPVQLN